MTRLPRIEDSNLPAPGDKVPSILGARRHVLAYGDDRSGRDGILLDQVDVVVQIFLVNFAVYVLVGKWRGAGNR